MYRQRKKDEEGAQDAGASDERQKEKDEEAVVLDNLTRGSIAAVEGQISEDVKQQPSITSLPKVSSQQQATMVRSKCFRDGGSLFLAVFSSMGTD